MRYVEQNEHTKRIKAVAVLAPNEEVPSGLLADLDVLDIEYPLISIQFVKVEGEFGPVIIKELSEKWKIPIHFMFMGSPHEESPYQVSELVGVRLII